MFARIAQLLAKLLVPELLKLLEAEVGRLEAAVCALPVPEIAHGD